MEYQRVPIKRHARISAREVDRSESRYWKSFKSSIFIKSYSPITSVSFPSSPPHRYAVTSGSRVQIYSPKTNKVVKTVSRFKETARSGRLRNDGKLMVAGDDEGLVQVFDVNSRAILRTFRDSKLPVHKTLFGPSSHSTSILTASDDSVVRLYDLPTSSLISKFEGHTDYVRSASFLSESSAGSSQSTLVSGGYDGIVKVWDGRTVGSGEEGGGVGEGKEVMSFDHGYPIEDLLVFPSKTLLLTAGGPTIRIWDLLSPSNTPLKTLSNHQKTVTCLGLDGEGKRVLSGGLDGVVKVYGVEDGWKVKHTMRYGGQILCLAISPENTHLVVGSSDGTLSIRRRTPSPTELLAKEQSLLSLQSGTYESLLTAHSNTGPIWSGLGSVLGVGKVANEVVRGTARGDQEVVVKGRQKGKKLKEWDKFMKSFRYSDALDSVLAKRDMPPATSYSVLLELIHRDGLHQALANRNDVSLEPILRFLLRYITDPRFSRTLCDVASVVIDIYNPILGLSPPIDDLFTKLRRKVDEEIKFQEELFGIRGALEMVMAGGAMSRV